jgi:hypothetical protein
MELGLIVTRHVEPAAFSVTPRVTFCTVEDVATAVDQDDEPRVGFYRGS